MQDGQNDLYPQLVLGALKSMFWILLLGSNYESTFTINVPVTVSITPFIRVTLPITQKQGPLSKRACDD